MKVDINDFYHTQDTRVYQDSVANSGVNDIGSITWDNACHSEWSFITNDDEKQIVINHVKAMGMDEVDEMCINQANALFIQLISSDIQEKANMSWEEYRQSEQVSQALFEENGVVYYFIDEM